MRLSKNELIQRFKTLEKFKDQKWFSEEAVKEDCNYKELPLKASFALLEDLIEYIEKIKFNSHWEMCFSVKTRINQIKDLLNHFCEDTEVEKTMKGSNLAQQDTIH